MTRAVILLALALLVIGLVLTGRTVLMSLRGRPAVDAFANQVVALAFVVAARLVAGSP